LTKEKIYTEPIPKKELDKYRTDVESTSSVASEVIETTTETIMPEKPSVDNWEEPITSSTTTTNSTTMEGAVFRPLEDVSKSSYTPPVAKEIGGTPTTSVPTERTNISPSSNYSTTIETEPSSTIVATKTEVIPEGTEYTMRGKSPRDNYEVVTTAPRRQGEYYKVQLIAVKTFDPDHSRYNPVENMGRLDTEYIVDRDLTRVLLAEYHSFDEAKAEMRRVRKYKNFERAFIVKYRDGERIGRVN